MNFFQSIVGMFPQSTRNASTSAHSTTSSSAHVQNKGASPDPFYEVRNNDSVCEAIKNSESCFVCGSVDSDRIGSEFPFFVDVHAYDITSGPRPEHFAHFTCLAIELAKPSEAPEICERTFQCRVCKRECYRKCFGLALCLELHKCERLGPKKYTALMLMCLTLISEYPPLAEITKNHLLTDVRYLLHLINYAIKDAKLKPYIEKFMDKHNFMLIFHPRDVLIRYNRRDKDPEKCSRRLNEASPGEISEVFEKGKLKAMQENNEIFAHFLFNALKESGIKGSGKDNTLVGSILDYIYLLNNDQFTYFTNEKILPKESIWERHGERYEYLFEENNPIENSYLSMAVTLSRGILGVATHNENQMLDIKLIILVVVCGVDLKADEYGRPVAKDEIYRVFSLVIAKLEEALPIIVTNNLARMIFSQYMYDSWFRTIYEKNRRMEGPTLERKEELIKISNNFLAKLLTRVSEEDVQKMKKLADSIGCYSIPFPESAL